MSKCQPIRGRPYKLSIEPDGPDAFEQGLNKEKRRRLQLLSRAQGNPKLQAALYKQCQADPLFWADNFVWTTDPRRQMDGLSPHMPMVMWPYQRRVFQAVLEWLRIIADKPRDMGLSYTVLAAFLWAWLFLPGVSFGVSSTTLMKIDDSSEKSLFGKLLYMLNRLPVWMLPRQANGKPAYTYRKAPRPVLENLRTGSYIVGQVATEDAFHGDRHLCILFDEAARVQRLHIVMKGVLGSTSSVVAISTPNGPSGWFPITIRGEGPAIEPYEPGRDPTPGHWQHIRLTIDEDPRKDAAWEEETRAALTEDQYEEQYGLSYTAGSLPGQIWPEYKEDLHVFSEKDWKKFQNEWLFDKSTRLYEAWDFGLFTAVVWVAVVEKDGERYAYVLDYRTWAARTVDEIAAGVARAGWYCEISADRHDEITARLGRQGRKPDYRVGDSSMSQRGSRDLRTWKMDLKDRGIELRAKSNRGVKASIDRIKLALKHERLFFSPKCGRKLDKQEFGVVPTLLASVENYHKDLKSADLRDWIEKSRAIDAEPVKDQFSHLADALRYAGDWIWGDDPVIKSLTQQADGTWQ